MLRQGWSASSLSPRSQRRAMHLRESLTSVREFSAASYTWQKVASPGFAEAARMDYRDVIYWAEYEEPKSPATSPRRVRDFHSPFD